MIRFAININRWVGQKVIFHSEGGGGIRQKVILHDIGGSDVQANSYFIMTMGVGGLNLLSLNGNVHPSTLLLLFLQLVLPFFQGYFAQNFTV